MHERDILLAALEKTRREEREAYLAEACGTDAELRSRVDDLLRASEVQDSFLERPAMETEVFNQKTNAVRQRDAEADELSLDFLQPSQSPQAIGRLGTYEVLEVIGRGGMGVVLKARDTKLNRVVAIKVLAPELASNPTARKRFQREAHAAAAVVHQHIVTIHAVDEDRVPYLVMECIVGQSLKEKIDREGHLPLVEILRIGQQVASGLAAAHAHGLIHRDVKPANILLENGVERVRITDFGLARAVDDVAITRTGEVAGTPQYMSPEQAQGLPIDARSDLFSLGCVLYAMCTGRPPFRAETAFATARRVCEDTPRPIREVNPEIPQWLTDIIERLLQKDPAQRFQSAKEVANLLGQYLGHVQHPSIVPLPGKELVSPKRQPDTRRSRWPLALIAPALVLALALGLTEASGVTQVVPTVIRIVRGEGTLVIEVADPTVQVSLDGEELSIRGAGLQELRLLPGTYRLHATKDGQPVKDEVVTITRDGRKVVTVTREGARGSGSTRGAPGVALTPSSTAAELFKRSEADGWVSLFNGKDLSGWQAIPAERWRVENGVLHGSGPDALLLSDVGDFQDFHLLVECRLNAGGDSGVYFRMPTPEPDPAGPWGYRFTGLEAEIGVYKAPGYRTGALTAKGPMRILATSPTPLHGPNEWVRLELVALKERIQIFVNGKLVTDYIDSERMLQRGHISLHTWENEKIKSNVEFRKVRIKKLSDGSDSVRTAPTERSETPFGPPTATGSADWVQLFNGHDLAGWKTPPNQPGNWRVENGVLIGSGPGALSHLYTEQGDFEDFHLRVEAKINLPGNSGVYFRASPPPITGFPAGYEAQICIEKQAVNDKPELHKTGSLFGLVRQNQVPRGAGPDEWFTMEVLAHGPRISIQVNGVITVNEFEDPRFRFRKGHLVLQQGSAETVVCFKKIEIKALSSEGKGAFVHPAEETVRNLTLLEKLDWHADLVRVVAYLPDDRRVVTVGHDKMVRIWDRANRSVLETLPIAGEGYLVTADVSADGRFLAILLKRDGKAVARVSDIEKREVVCEFAPDLNANNVMQFSPDGTRLVTSGSPLPHAVLWDATTGTELGRFDSGDGATNNGMHRAAFSPNGRMLALGAIGRVRLFDVESKEVVAEIQLPSVHSVSDLVFAPGGRTLATGQDGGHITLTDVDSHRVLKTLRDSSAKVRTLRFLGNDLFLMTSSHDATLRVWDVERERVVAQAATGNGTNHGLFVSPDGRQVLTAGGKEWDDASHSWKDHGDYALRLWELPESVWPEQPTSGAAVQKPLAPAATLPQENLKLLDKLDWHTDVVRAVASLPDGRRLLTVGNDKMVRIWDRANHSALESFQISGQGSLAAAEVSSDGRFVAVVHYGDSKAVARVWDLEKREVVCEVAPPHAGNQWIRFSPDGTRLVTSGLWLPEAVLWDPITGMELGRFDLGDGRGVWRSAFSPNGRLLALGGAGRVRLFDVETRDLVADVPLADPWNVWDLEFAPGGKTLATGQGGGHVSLIDIDSRRVMKTLRSTSPVHSVRFLGNDLFLLACSADATLRVWDLKSEKVVAQAATGNGLNHGLFISPDGRQVITAGGKQWDDASRSLKDHGNYALRLWELPESVWPKKATEQTQPQEPANQATQSDP